MTNFLAFSPQNHKPNTMEIKKIDTTQLSAPAPQTRPDNFSDFIGQEHIKKMLKTAIGSAQKRAGILGHILFS
jgi:Holliday junction resolvasome RuvABC ATP-dependent DNA helicase subunit